MKRLFPIFFGILLLVFGFFLKGVVSGSNDVCTVDAEGTVIGYETTTSDDGGRINRPIVQYSYGGKTYQECGNVGTGDKPYADGELVLIHINPDNPYEFTIDGSTDLFVIVSWVIIAIGIIMILSEIYKILRFGFGSGGGGGRHEMGLIAIIMAIAQNAKEKRNSPKEGEQ